MFFKYLLFFLILSRIVASSQQEDVGFTYNGFRGVNMSLDGLAQITQNGLLMLANTTKREVGHAFYPQPVSFLNKSSGNVLSSFSTTFVFAMFSELAIAGGPGIVLVISSSKKFPGAFPSSYFGLFNTTNTGKSSNHVIGVELDTTQNKEFNDINDNHVGININGLISLKSAPASYFSDEENQFVNLSLRSGNPMQLWVEYDGTEKQFNVTLAPISIPKPKIPLLSLIIDLSQTIMDPMFVGFSSSTSALDVYHFVLGWSFKMNGKAKELSLSQLPKLPRMGMGSKTKSRTLVDIGFPVICVSLVLLSIFIIQFIVRRKKKFAEVIEDWELEYGPQRFKYKDLYIATKGFNEKQLLGIGGFGKVYKGILLPNSKEIAVKRVSHDSRQGVREFIAEIVSIGKLHHRNIVTLLGYCRRKGELFLVYDFMANGSLDKFIFENQSSSRMNNNKTLSWNQRFHIVKGVASALLYLHQEWEQVVVHRDVKSSNVMLDEELNGKLGDFGLARLYDHGGGDPKSTHVVGTFGYLAPELSTTRKVNPSIDVFAFGVFLLEVACGRRPIEPQASEECLVLVDWVISSWCKGLILETVDPKLEMNYEVEEMELVLKLGLFCTHSIPTARPSMQQVVRYLEGEVPLPELLPSLSQSHSMPLEGTGGGDFSIWCPYLGSSTSPSSSIADSLLSGGR
ncbi:L-type lectin-domain containing receptor kinase IV.1-like [Telopea speciosissima]|uniref:L-type lectin-domain containing receptor kinase IV.1-like n=1 Tax=Telopea speciosissima TaxID=54955 RepID=UPI001CC4CB4D|nr:L-type lectin-domain containing receptor kinase IV.1-like [Telopea speciosissima]